ncbi:leucine-rich repeat domain-containing protein [uncultured Arcticibacterium sp.]|uniref:leucine-rich repeat domain-containing protein n=1 Tax=uncultured Arcticibacterium sp. TaxID=2173042 RepID=UPI0030FA8740
MSLWWQSLSPLWKSAFNLTVLVKDESYVPSQTELKEILSLKVLRIVGPKGVHPNFDYHLEDLTGLKELKELEILVVTYHKIKKLDGIRESKNLRTLFIHDNEIEDLSPLKDLKLLNELYCHSNMIATLKPLRALSRLRVLFCSNNQISDFNGISEKHSELKSVTAMPNEKIGPKQIRELEDLNIFCK